MSLPPRAPLRTPSQSKISEPPSPKIPPGEAKYSDRFKTVASKPDATPDITSVTEFPSLFKGPIALPNLVVMPTISFADKVKQMALAEATTKAQAAAERVRRDQEEQREQRERERYASIYSGRAAATQQQDSWNTTQDDDGWTPGTPEFGRDEFLNQGEGDDDWSNN